MFYSQQVLTKKGPLAKIWLAAHMQSKLTKAMVFATDLSKAVDSIITPEVPMALRLTSNLLLGVVRILHRKTKYLLQESSDALTKLKLTFRPPTATSVDLPATTPAQNFAAVTLADASVDDLDAPMVDLSLVPSRPSRPSASSQFLAADRDITIDEFAGGLAGGMLDAFAMEPELDTAGAAGLDLADLDADAHEPLMFTPSQRVSQSQQVTPRTPSVVSAPSSVEIMRGEITGERPEGEEAPALSIERTSAPPTPLPGADVEAQVSEPTTPVPRMDIERPSPVPEVPPSPQLVTPAQPEPAQIPPTSPPLETPEQIRAREGVPVQPSPIPMGPLAEEAVTGEVPEITTPKTPPVQPPRDTDDEARLLGTTPVLPEGELEAERRDAARAARISTGDDELALAEALEEDETEAEGDAKFEADVETEAEELRKRGRKRKRVLIEDPTTEMSVSDFRACLNDTSDLLRQRRGRADRIRRRLYGRYHGRRELEPFEEFLSRPSVTLAPQLNELFAMSFRVDDYTGQQVGSPMTDVEVTDKDAARPEARTPEKGPAEEAVEKPSIEESPEKPSEREEPTEAIPPEVSPEKPGELDVPEISPEKSVGDSRSVSQVAETERPVEKPVVSGPHPVTPPPGVTEEERRISMEPPSAVQIPEEAIPEEQFQAFDLSKISLKDVASTRSQVDAEGVAAGQDVTESTVSARTRKMQEYILQHLGDDGELNFSEAMMLEPGMTRRTAARTFYELLNLGSKKALQLSQSEAYGTIRARPVQPTFDSLAKNT